MGVKDAFVWPPNFAIKYIAYLHVVVFFCRVLIIKQETYFVGACLSLGTHQIFDIASAEYSAFLIISYFLSLSLLGENNSCICAFTALRVDSEFDDKYMNHILQTFRG